MQPTAPRLFTLPRGGEFSIPAEWWTESGMDAFERRSGSYRFAPSPELLLVAVEDIEPMKMEGRLHLGPGGFHPERMIDVLRRIASDLEMAPIERVERERDPYRYVIGHGVHRFYASVAAGFTQIPTKLGWLPDSETLNWR